MAETCPKCGADYHYVRYWEAQHCECDSRANGEAFIPSEGYLTLQLAQWDERIKELEGERDQLRADLATVAPVVRAAMEQEDHHSDAARHYPHDPRDLCACGVCVQVRSLPAAVLERMGVDRG